jgi:hypothetical protein
LIAERLVASIARFKTLPVYTYVRIDHKGNTASWTVR